MLSSTLKLSTPLKRGQLHFPSAEGCESRRLTAPGRAVSVVEAMRVTISKMLQKQGEMGTRSSTLRNHPSIIFQGAAFALYKVLTSKVLVCRID